METIDLNNTWEYKPFICKKIEANLLNTDYGAGWYNSKSEVCYTRWVWSESVESGMHGEQMRK